MQVDTVSGHTRTPTECIWGPTLVHPHTGFASQGDLPAPGVYPCKAAQGWGAHIGGAGQLCSSVLTNCHAFMLCLGFNSEEHGSGDLVGGTKMMRADVLHHGPCTCTHSCVLVSDSSLQLSHDFTKWTLPSPNR